MILIEIRHLDMILQLIFVAFDSLGDKESNDRSHDPVRGVLKFVKFDTRCHMTQFWCHSIQWVKRNRMMGHLTPFGDF